MRPFTEVLPKPLIPFLNTPIISYPLTQLNRAGVSTIAINLHHLPDTIPPVVDRIGAAFGQHIRYVHEWEILGSGGGILGISSTFDDEVETLVLMNGDTVLDVDLGPHIDAHLESGAAVSLLVRPKVDSQPGRVFVDGETITRIRDYKKPGTNSTDEFDFLGVHIIQRAALSEFEIESCDIIDCVYGPLLEAGEMIRASHHDGFFAALDSPQLLYETSVAVLENPESCGIAPLPAPLREALYVYRPGAIAGAAEVAPPVLIGANVEVGVGAHIGKNVVLDGVTVAEGTRIENSILYGMGHIEGTWQNCVGIAGKVFQL